jgi:SAM-dependent methyltransferase
MECPACQSAAGHKPTDKAIATRIASYGLWTCDACSTSFAMPRVPAPAGWYAEVGEYYGWRWEFDVCLAELKQRLPPGSSVMEIGCGEGRFLERVRESGFRALGNDLNTTALEEARRKGLQVVAGELSQVSRTVPPGSLDAIVLFHVLEHVGAPGAFARQLGLLLKPDGFLILSIPNPNRARARIAHEFWDYPPHHLTRFSLEGLVRLLADAGFHVLRTAEQPLDTNVYRLASIRANHLAFGDRAEGAEAFAAAWNREDVARMSAPARYARKVVPFLKSIPLAISACRTGRGTALYAAARKLTV